MIRDRRLLLDRLEKLVSCFGLAKPRPASFRGDKGDTQHKDNGYGTRSVSTTKPRPASFRGAKGDTTRQKTFRGAKSNCSNSSCLRLDGPSREETRGKLGEKVVGRFGITIFVESRQEKTCFELSADLSFERVP